jgi:hypothetical protein
LGLNIQGAGGAGRSAVIVGSAFVDVIKCPLGVVIPSENNCPTNSTNAYRIPINFLHMKQGLGSPKQFQGPFVQAISDNSACLIHVTQIIRTGNSIGPCDLACQATQGTVQAISDCANGGIQVIPADDTRNRVRAALNGFGLNGSAAAIPDNLFQTATSTMCDGEVVAEFAVNTMPTTAILTGTFKTITVSLMAHPRLQGQRCNGVAALLCYQTNRGAGVHGIFGDADGDVCATDFVLTGNPAVDFPPNSPTLVNDPTLPVIAGDILDTRFKLSTQIPATCLPDIPQMCFDARRRFCFNAASECNDK